MAQWSGATRHGAFDANPFHWSKKMNKQVSPNPLPSDILCAKQASKMLGCSAWMLYELCKDGRIPHIRLGRMLRFRRSSLLEWLAERESQSVNLTA
jgi:excisionase family DNA binding protein